MEKKYRFLTSILWLFFIVRLDAREDKNQIVFERQFTCVPNTQVFTQIDQFQDATSFDLTPPQFSTFSSTSQDWYQQYRQFVLNNVVGMRLQGKIINITPEDIALIDRICKDNPHKDQDALRMQLSQSSAFNYAQHFLKGDLLLHAFAPDVFIDLAHFKQVSASDYRMKQVQQAAKDAMQDRHKREKGRLESQQKAEANVAKKLSKSEKKKVDNRHKQEWTALENKQKEETKYPFGVKNKTVQKPSKVASVQPNSSSQILQSTIPVQDLQNLQTQYQLIKSDASSLQKVMEKRSKAIESSIKNQTPILQSIKINPQTAGFLEAQGIDTQQFMQVEGLPIQHVLTHELVEILDSVADFAMQHRHELYQTHLTKYCAYLGSLTQQSNMQGALQQAIDGTNCCHGIQNYLVGMVSGIEQKYQQFQTALDYFDTVLDQYGNFIALHAGKGAAVAHGLEAIITAGMIAAPVTTVAATGVMIAATAYTMAPLCAQAMIDTISFGGACITGNWDKITSDLDNFKKFMSKKETVARMAEFAGGSVMPTPNLSNFVEQILSLRPVITSVQNASGEMVQSFYLMTKNQLQKVWHQSAELLKLPEFVNFNATYQKICGVRFFDILPKSHPALIPVFADGLEIGAMNSAEHAALTSLFTQSSESVVGSGITKIMKPEIQKEIKKVVISLHKRIIDVVENKGGLERLSAIEQNAVVKIINIGGKRGGDLKNIDVQFSKNINHLFADRAGHLPNTLENKSLIMNLVKDVQNYYGPNKWGNLSYAKILPDGTQLWAVVKNNVTIENCGLNEMPKQWNKITGFSALISPIKK